MPDIPENTGDIRDEQGRFVPGVSGNPNGKPKGSLSVVAEIKKRLQEVPEGEKKTNLEIMVNKIIDLAKRGNEPLIRSVLQYIDGMPKQSIDLNVKEEEVNKEKLSEIDGKLEKQLVENTPPANDAGK